MFDDKAPQEDSLLLISGSKGSKEDDKEYAKKVATAIQSCITKYDKAKLRCVGAASENNAIKAIIIAATELAEETNLLIEPSFTMVEIDKKERTGMMLEVVTIDDLIKEGNLNYDDAILKVKGDQGSKEANKEYVKKLASAILSCFYKQKTALLRYVGAAACNHAIKAAAIAKGEAAKRGEVFMLEPRFTEVEINGEPMTGVILEVINVKNSENII